MEKEKDFIPEDLDNENHMEKDESNQSSDLETSQKSYENINQSTEPIILEEDNFSNHNNEIIEEEIIREETNYNQGYEMNNNYKKERGFKGSLFSYIILGLVTSILGGFVSFYMAMTIFTTDLQENGLYNGSPITINPSEDMNIVSAVAKKAMSSVVGITTVEVQQYFWSQQEIEGVGSGVIVNSNGYILTNSHVIADGNAKSITVLFENGEKLPATILWYDSSLDLAMVKVDKTGLPVAELGDSDALEIGEIAIAIGNPLGLAFERSVTSGIISGLNRSIQVSANNVIGNLIQTDASINQGNSGGPLLNSKGQVIGINTAKMTSAEGLGFSIPINEIKPMIEEVIQHGSFSSVVMGISGISAADYNSRLGVNVGTDKGVVLVEVIENKPAHKAGLMSGDIIIAMDDIEIDTMNKLKKTLYKYKNGDTATLKILRNKSEVNIEIQFTE